MLTSVVVATILVGVLASTALGQAAESPFAQFNATIYQLKGQSPLANWESLPFSEPVVWMAHDASSKAFFLSTKAGDIFLGVDENNGSPGLRFFNATPERVAGCHFTTCLPSSGPSSVVAVCPAGDPGTHHYAVSQLTINASSGTLGFLSNFALSPLPAPVNAIAVQHGSSNHSEAHLLIGTQSGLVAVGMGPSTPAPAPIHIFTLHNTTGSMVQTSDITNIICLPSDFNVTRDTFFGARCFASSNEHYIMNDDGLLPMDLVHLINGLEVVRFIRIPAVIDRRPTAATYDRQRQAIHFANDQCVNVLSSTGELDRVEGVHGGLPQHNLTAAATTDAYPFPWLPSDEQKKDGSTPAVGSLVWFGSKFGAMVRLPNDKWKYFFGPRWLPSQGFTGDATRVNAIAANDKVAILATASSGLSVIRTIAWTLSEKNKHFQAMAVRHNRFGLATRNALKEWGNIYKWHKEEGTANDGLWSSLYLSAEIFRYMATKDPKAKANAWQTFKGMELLFKVTGIRGYPARSLQPFPPASMHGWRNSTTMPGWYWWGGTSSDEITGHLQAYPLMHDIIADTAEEKARVRHLINNITGAIVDNGYRLIGYEGKPTRWGFWGPHQTNDEPSNYDERGLNSMELLGYLASAYRITGNETYKRLFDELDDKHGYGDNLVNLKVTQPTDVDYSDDELTFSAYMTFFWAGQPGGKVYPNPCYEKVKTRFQRSVVRTWRYVRRYKPAIWAAMFVYMLGEERGKSVPEHLFAEAEEAVNFCLRTYPTSMVTWPYNNADRLDVHYSIHGNRNTVKHMLLTTMLPYDEITLLLWNGDPFDKSGGGAWQEMDPSAFNYPYWVARVANITM